MALEHSSPAVRAEAATARDKLLEGVGELQASARKGRDVVSELLRTRLADALGAATTPPEVAAHMGSLGTSLLERLFAGKLSTSLLAEAPQRLAAELVPLAVAVGATSLAEKLPPVCEAAVEAFVEQLPLRAQQVLTSSDGKDYLVDVQNCILAFAGRVLLKKADIRFQRGHRYGLIGQNGVGKTTLLNRLSAGDIRGFPPGLNVHYIRHEVVCEDGVDVVAFCMQKATGHPLTPPSPLRPGRPHPSRPFSPRPRRRRPPGSRTPLCASRACSRRSASPTSSARARSTTCPAAGR